ncbi:MAG: GTPase Era [Bacteroidota bacterium]|nr:GTPase Era [Bacteroidota bacterium]
MSFKSGFVNIIGLPNAGKSTLINKLIQEKVSIISPKVQTTRHRILGIINDPNFQMIFSDTPGIINDPKYPLHNAMMKFVNEAIADADVMVYIIDINDWRADNRTLIEDIKKKYHGPLLILLNKIDLSTQERVEKQIEIFSAYTPVDNILPISASNDFNLELIKNKALEYLPEHPGYYPDDQFTDKTERFLAAEVIRGKIFNYFRQEIPYATEVAVTEFKEEENIIRIAAEIFVERLSQKGIIIGRGGEALKRIATDARLELEENLKKKVFLEVFVKVKEDWRSKTNNLRQFGFEL